jgi:cyclophilin family peptidyl-prolyl cis-trans isomerase
MSLAVEIQKPLLPVRSVAPIARGAIAPTIYGTQSGSDLPKPNPGLNKTSPMTKNLPLILSFCFATWTTASGQNVAPVVKTPIAAFTEFAGAPARSIDLTTTFSDPDASNAVQMAVLLPSSTGFFNIALDGQHKPITVANFLNYVNSGRYFMTDPTTHGLASSFIHRSISNFVVQGGGFIGTVNPSQPAFAQPTPVPAFSPIQNEPGISNKTGTIAMAKLDGNPNSATSQWFINLVNNGGPPANLDTTNGGFTVFGHVTGVGMTVVNAIAAVPVFNIGSPFDSLPLRNYTSGQFIKVANLVSVAGITVISPLTFTASSDNPTVATATISGKNLLVAPRQAGTAHIMAKATDLDGANVSQTFTVTVTTTLPGPNIYVLYHAATRRTAIWYLNNNAFVSGAYGPTLPAGWEVAGAADFNSDSHPDYALFNSVTHQTALWYLSGPTFLSGAYGSTLPNGWALVATADFNGDGHPDYVLENAGTRQTAVWYLNNNLFVSGAYGPTLPAGWEVAGVADFDRDSHADYALFDPSTRQTAIWYLSGATLIRGAYGPTLPSGWALVATADFNGDSYPDYVLYNADTRQTAIWYLNNNAFVSGAYGPTLPAGWSLVAP